VGADEASGGALSYASGIVSMPAAAPDSKAPPAFPTLILAAEAVWVAAQKRNWSSLVVVPAEPSLVTVPIARALAATASAQRGEAVEFLDLRGLALAESRPLAERLADNGKPYRQVASVSCPLDSQTALLLSSSADAAILVLEQDRTPLASARRVVEIIGQSRFVGAIVLGPFAK
jgi:hypothetical protein